MSNMIVTLSLENKRGEKDFVDYIEDLNSLFFSTGVEGTGLDFNIEFSEQINNNEAEIDLLFTNMSELKNIIGLIRNPSKVVYSTKYNTQETELDREKLSVKKIIELGEFDDIEYNPLTLEVIGQ